jgi:hypothetical protein
VITVAAATLDSFSLSQLVLFVANLAVLFGLMAKALPLFRRLGDLADDWSGEPARPGVPSRPGVMERLQALDEKTQQLEHNGGSSLRDDVSAMRAQLDEHIRSSVEERIAYWQALALVHPSPPRPALPPAATDEKG